MKRKKQNDSPHNKAESHAAVHDGIEISLELLHPPEVAAENSSKGRVFVMSLAE
jgi:hypothetical protein